MVYILKSRNVTTYMLHTPKYTQGKLNNTFRRMYLIDTLYVPFFLSVRSRTFMACLLTLALPQPSNSTILKCAVLYGVKTEKCAILLLFYIRFDDKHL